MAEPEKEEEKAVKPPRDDLMRVVVGAMAFMVGGGTGTVTTLAVTKASVDRLTSQVEKLEGKVEHLLIDRWSRAEQQAFQDRMEKELDKLKDRIEARPPR